MTEEQMKALQEQITRLQAENEALKAAKPQQRVSFKVSDKGAVSVYGLGRFPVTLYESQWNALLERSEQVRAFIASNQDKLKHKPE